MIARLGLFLLGVSASAILCADEVKDVGKQPLLMRDAKAFYGVQPLSPPIVQTHPEPQYWSQARKWQGIPGIERSPGGRLWATWYAGPFEEGGEGNYALLVTSGDDGKTWSEPVAVYNAPGFFESKTFDPHLWSDPQGRLWWVLQRSLPVPGFKEALTIWALRVLNPESAEPTFAPPVFVGYGVAINKPTVLADGSWLQPTVASDGDPDRIQFYLSKDQGASYAFLSKAPAGSETDAKFYCESMVVEHQDGSLWLLFRTKDGIRQAKSWDHAESWTSIGYFTKQRGINTRFFIRRLQSGHLLMVLNDDPKSRTNMTAMLSDDDGRTWPHQLMLDARPVVSYPDGKQAPDGSIYVIYDRGRYMKGQQEILLAKIREEDIVAGKVVAKDSRLQQVINRLADTGGGADRDWQVLELRKKLKPEAPAQNK